MKLVNKEIAIVGGGPGGLTLARLLQLAGASVRVYERDLNKDARVQGSPLDLHDDSGLAALRKANLMEEFKANYMPGADRLVIANEHGEICFSDHENDEQSESFGDKYFRPEIDRGVLRKILLESLQPETVVWNAHFVFMEKLGEGWNLIFKNGETAYADIVVAADGANSKLRPYITNIKPFYSGITMLEGSIYHSTRNAAVISGMINGGKIMAFGNEKCLLMGMKANDTLGFYASLKVDENWATNNGLNYADAKQILAWFRQVYPEWSQVWHELFENVSTPFIPRPIYCMPFDQNWDTLPNLTMIGDAAHVMPPFAGEGANMAMQDALELSECLISDKFDTIQQAISQYETDMRYRASMAAKESIENGERMHAASALETMMAMFAQ